MNVVYCGLCYVGYEILVVFPEILEDVGGGLWGMEELCQFSDNIVCPLDCVWSDYNFTLVGGGC
jgi:hypothetical protein